MRGAASPCCGAPLSSYWACAAALAGCLTPLWALSVRLRDSSIVDIFWGLGFVLVAWVTFAVAEGHLERKLVLAGLTTLWGIRLSVFLALRNLGHGEDARYSAMRHRHGPSWWWRSFFIVFALQGVLLFVVSLPVQVAQHAEQPPLGALDALGALVTLTGVLFETLGDWQLARFRSQPENKGLIMTSGLWRFTRHPNYFGDFLVWWGLFVIACATANAWFTVVGPVVMSILLMRVSGVTLLEKTMRKRPGYAEYAARTNAFFPWPPKKPFTPL